jgi:hypothetical protein
MIHMSGTWSPRWWRERIMKWARKRSLRQLEVCTQKGLRSQDMVVHTHLQHRRYEQEDHSQRPAWQKLENLFKKQTKANWAGSVARHVNTCLASVRP